MLTAPPLQALGLTLNWLYFARGDFQRAADALRRDIANSDRENRIVRRALNDRMMKVGIFNWFFFLHKGSAGWDEPFPKGPWALCRLVSLPFA